MADLQEIMTSSIGEIGLAQWVIMFSLRGGAGILAWGMIMMSYAGIVPDWWSVPHGRNLTGNESVAEIGKFKTCPTSSDEMIVFDLTIKSVVSQWSLVCDRSWILSTITMVQMIGVFIGASICGLLGDWIGRKKTAILYFATAVLFTYVSVFSGYWQIFTMCRFFIGFAIGGYLVIHYPYFVEYIGISWRTSMNTIPFWSVGVITFGISMMYVDDWSKLALGSAICMTPLLLWLCFLPESARWLFIKGRQEEAIEVLKRMARWNRRDEPKIDSLDISENTDPQTYTYITLFRNRSTRYPIIVCCMMWFCCSIIYYGFTFGVSNLSGNPGLNMSLFGLTEIGAVVLVWIMSKCLGRRQMTILFFSLAAAFSLAIFLQYFIAPSFYNTRRNIFAIIARCWLSSGWAAGIIITQEVFPTSVRALGIGLSSTAGRLGGIIGAQMKLVHDIHSAAPYAVYGMLLIMSAVMVYFLKETHDEPLQDFLEKSGNTQDNKSTIIAMSGENNESYTPE